VLVRIVRDPRGIKAAELFERAADRGELPRGADLELAADLLAGDRLADRIVAAVTSG
jgi:hypothetical protein